MRRYKEDDFLLICSKSETGTYQVLWLDEGGILHEGCMGLGDVLESDPIYVKDSPKLWKAAGLRLGPMENRRDWMQDFFQRFPEDMV